MSRIDVIIFEMVYKIEFTLGTRRYHVHETNLALVLNEKLNCKRDNREEALSYDEHCVGVFNKGGALMVIHLLNFPDWLITLWKRIKINFVSALVVRPKKRELGLVVPARFTAVTKELRVGTILSAETLTLYCIMSQSGQTHFKNFQSVSDHFGTLCIKICIKRLKIKTKYTDFE